MKGYIGPGKVAVAATLGIMAGAGITALAAHNAHEVEVVTETEVLHTIAADPAERAIAYDSGYDDGMADGYQEGQALTADKVAVARAAGEDYGYEAASQQVQDAVRKALLACHEDEVFTITFECVPLDDADFTADRGWVAK